MTRQKNHYLDILQTAPAYIDDEMIVESIGVTGRDGGNVPPPAGGEPCAGPRITDGLVADGCGQSVMLRNIGNDAAVISFPAGRSRPDSGLVTRLSLQLGAARRGKVPPAQCVGLE